MPSRPSEESEHSSELLTVLDLPQLYTRPSAETLLDVLDTLSLRESTPFNPKTVSEATDVPSIDENGLPAYLTRIISSPLAWIHSDEEKEKIWEAASQCLSERSGRTALSTLTRTFRIPMPSQTCALPSDALLNGIDTSLNKAALPETQQSENNFLDIKLTEPALTADNLGHKTWGSSYTLSLRLPYLLSQYFPSAYNVDYETPISEVEMPVKSRKSNLSLNVLELGAGTGLTGLTVAALLSLAASRDQSQERRQSQSQSRDPSTEAGPGLDFNGARTKSELQAKARVHLTDLPEIVPNLQSNITLNKHLFNHHDHGEQGCEPTAGVLDWITLPQVSPRPLPNAGADMNNVVKQPHSLSSSGPSNQDVIAVETDQDPRSIETEEKFNIILTTDPIYSENHPKLVSNAMATYLNPNPNPSHVINHNHIPSIHSQIQPQKSYVFICLPFRDMGPWDFHDSLRSEMVAQGFEVVEESVVRGWDDWGNDTRNVDHDDDDGDNDDEEKGVDGRHDAPTLRFWISVWTWVR